MASKKQAAPAPSYVRATATFAHGLAAEGAQYVRPGFAFTKEDDLRFALGFPHCRTLLEDHPDDANAAEVAKAHIRDIVPLMELLELPREVAMRMARALASDWIGATNWGEEGEKVFAQAGPIELDEAKRLIETLMLRPSPSRSPHVVLWILEALHGPEAMADILLTSMESLEAAPRFSDFLIYQLGFLLLRVRAGVAAKLRTRANEVFLRWAAKSGLTVPLPVAEANGPNFEWTLRALDTVLHGAAGAARSLLPIVGGHDIRGLAHVLDAPAFVRKMAAQEPRPSKASRDYLDARIAFLGGIEVIDLYEERIDRLKSVGERKRILETFGAIRAPNVVAVILSLARTSKVKKDAFAWLTLHADYTKSILTEFTTGTDERAALAAEVLPLLA